MYRNFICYLILLFTSSLTIAQYTPIKISSDNTPSSIYQSDARIYRKPNGNFLAAWLDLRNGSSTYYKQEFTKGFERIGSNYKTESNLKTVFWNDSDFVNFYSFSTNNVYDITRFHLQARIHGNELDKKIMIGEDDFPWCGTGWLGYSNDIEIFQNSFLTAYRFGGMLRVSRFDDDGTLKFSKEFTGYDYSGLAEQALAVDLLALPEYYVVCWSDIDYNDYRQSLNYEIYNSADSLTASSLGFYSLHTDDSFWLDDNRAIRTVNMNDTSFAVVFFDSLGLKMNKFSLNSSEYEELNYKFNFDPESNVILSPHNFSIAGIDSSRILVVVTIRDWYNETYTDYSITADFSRGEVNSDIIENIKDYYRYNDELYTDDEEFMIASYRNDGDVYAVKLNGGTVVDSILLNDDLSGSNEYSPTVSIAGNNNFFCSWQDELNSKGITVDSEGKPVSDQLTVNTDKYCFIDEENIISLDSENLDGSLKYFLKARDNRFNVLDSTELASSSNKVVRTGNLLLYPDCIILSYAINNTVHLVKYDYNLIKIAESSFDIDDNPNVYHLQVFKSSENEFWLDSNTRLRKFSKDFVELINVGSIPNTGYLQKDKFFYSYKTYPDTTYLKIVDLIEGTLGVLSFGAGISDFTCLPVSDNEIVALYLKNNNIYSLVSDYELNIRNGEQLIYSAEHGEIKQFAAMGNDENILISYSGRESIDSNFDIFTISLSKDEITSVRNYSNGEIPSKFLLKDNYPNPFNPTTTIEYSIPNVERDSVSLKSFTRFGESRYSVTLKIYDILGREVATLVNQQQKPGNYRIQFDASGLSSGLYLYRLTSGENSTIKKMLLMK